MLPSWYCANENKELGILRLQNINYRNSKLHKCACCTTCQTMFIWNTPGQKPIPKIGFTWFHHSCTSTVLHAPHAARPFNSPFQYPRVCIQRPPCAGKNLSELLDGILSRQQISRDDANCSKPHTDQWHCYTHSQPKILCCIVWLLATSMLHQVSSWLDLLTQQRQIKSIHAI